MRRFILPALLLLIVSCGRLFADPPTKGSEFARDVLPFIEKHCLACHNPEKKKANLILSAYREEASIAKDRVVWQAVARMVHTGEMPPSARPRPAVEDVERFNKALGILFDRADQGKRDPGRVTIRRLNRTEYNNTIRDLVGVDFQPAEDFPSDDVGYGFDNIGDVLSLSPVLMERYFAAAEGIAQRAVLVGAAEDCPATGRRSVPPAARQGPRAAGARAGRQEGIAVVRLPSSPGGRVHLPRARLWPTCGSERQGAAEDRLAHRRQDGCHPCCQGNQ